MKKTLLVLIILILSSNLFANTNTFNISCVLIDDYNELNDLFNTNTVEKVLNNSSNDFTNFEQNSFNFIYDILNNNITNLLLSQYFIDIKNNEIQSNLIIEKRKQIEKKYINYASSLDDKELIEIEELKNKEFSFEKVNLLTLNFIKNNNNFAISILKNSNDAQIIKTLLDSINSSAIILVSISDISDYKKIKIEYVDLNKKTLIYNKIIENNLIENQKEDILKSFINFFNNEYSILSLKDTNNIISISEIVDISKQRLEKELRDYSEIKIREKDIIKLDINNDYLILKKGIHFLNIESLNKNEIIKIEIDDNINNLVYKNESKSLDTLNIISNNGLLDIYLNGQYLSNKAVLNLKNIDLPFYIEATKEGFNNQIIQIDENINQLNFNLLPKWQNQSIEQAQDEFYTSLLTYIFINFTTLTINNITDAIEFNNYDVAIDIFSTSLSVFSSINILNKLISYIKIATN